MRNEVVVTRVSRAILVITVALAALLAPIAPVAHAQDAVDEGGAQMIDPVMDRWWGVGGAILCAAEIRLVRVVPAIGMNPYAIAVGVGGCLLAAIDVLTTE